MGIKRSRINKSCFENKSSFDIRKSYDNSFQKNSREEIEVYKHSVLPFRADDINGIRNEINALATEKELSRQRNSPVKNS